MNTCMQKVVRRAVCCMNSYVDNVIIDIDFCVQMRVNSKNLNDLMNECSYAKCGTKNGVFLQTELCVKIINRIVRTSVNKDYRFHFTSFQGLFCRKIYS